MPETKLARYFLAALLILLTIMAADVIHKAMANVAHDASLRAYSVGPRAW